MLKSMKFKSVYVVLLLALLLSVLPSAGGGVALAGTNDLAPLGPQLGDVGQYYSQVSPSMGSVTYVQNTSSSNTDVVIVIYNGNRSSPLAPNPGGVTVYPPQDWGRGAGE